ncbi:MAG: Eco57I restriction-modification methylase domain-containing protein [Candidatus Thorarchaeota archaeon]
MPGEELSSKGSQELSWNEIMLECRKTIDQDLGPIQDEMLRNFCSQAILNRILLIFAFWRKSILFQGNQGFLQDNFHGNVMIPFLKLLSKNKTGEKRLWKRFSLSALPQKSLLFPTGGSWSISDIQVSDATYANVFAKLELKTDRIGIKALKDLFGSEILGEAFEFSLTRTDKKLKGVFYTPSYITDGMTLLAIEKFMIAHLEEGVIDRSASKEFKTKKLSVKNNKILNNVLHGLKILDNAVGCGEYLLSALEILGPLYKMAQMQQRKDEENYDQRARVEALHAILENNLYGVDISPAAVDTCKIRLWGNLLLESEEESDLWPLPDLDSRIRVGNSLIGFPLSTPIQKSRVQDANWPNGFSEESYNSVLSDLSLLGNKEDLRALIPFHWPKEFPSIFQGSKNREPGFSIIIGNPPFQSTKRSFFSQMEKRLYTSLFLSASRQWDIYELFVERSLELLQPNGYLCYLLPKPLLTNENMEALRKMLLNESTVLKVLDLGLPFQDAGVELITILISASDRNTDSKMEIGFIDREKGVVINHEVPQAVFKSFPSSRFAIGLTELEIEIIGRIKSRCVPFSKTISRMTRGIECGKKSPAINQNGQGLPLLRGEDVERYYAKFSSQFIHFNKNNPSIFKKIDLYTGSKILLRRVASGLIAAEDKKKRLFLNTIYGIKPKENLSISFLLALLNSKLLNWWFNHVFLFEDNLFPYVRKSQLLELPIRLSTPNLSEKKAENIQYSLFERYQQAIGNLADIMQILVKENEYALNKIIDAEVLDLLVFELYFFEELNTKLLAAVETILLDYKIYDDPKILISNISKSIEDSSKWRVIRDETSHIMRNKIFLASIGSEKFRKIWKKIHRNQR